MNFLNENNQSAALSVALGHKNAQDLVSIYCGMIFSYITSLSFCGVKDIKIKYKLRQIIVIFMVC